MDKLLNISREGGYPLCAETLQVLYDNARAVNVLLAGLPLPNKSAVILGSEETEASRIPAGSFAYTYLYVVSAGGRRLVRYTRNSGVNLSSAKVTITETLNTVYDSGGNEISDVYTEERAVIESTDVAADKWKFYNLTDVLEPSLYNNLLPAFQDNLTGTNVSLDENYHNILGKNDRKLRVRLKLDASVSNNPTPVSSNTYTMDVSIPISIAGAHSLNAVLLCNNQHRPVRATLIGSTIKIYAGEALSSIANDTTWYSQSWSMYINSEILL
jgi:hypothetical protein